ncbi:MAG: hypothetical protein WB495_17655 [Xanthobacteraceae bacterium]
MEAVIDGCGLCRMPNDFAGPNEMELVLRITLPTRFTSPERTTLQEAILSGCKRRQCGKRVQY